jgi:NADH-quinone oxidoreductase subunit C
VSEALRELGEYITAGLREEVTGIEVALGELVVRVERGALVRTLSFLRDDANCQFKCLMDICGVDYPEREERFEIVYNLLSLTHNQRVRVKLTSDADTPVPTATGVFSSAGWWEREAWDLFGIYFTDHPDLRRILTDYGFEGHPLRKDFPLTGYVEMRYDDEQKRIVYEPVELVQEFRNFDFLSPREGAEYILSDDASDRNGGGDGDGDGAGNGGGKADDADG